MYLRAPEYNAIRYIFCLVFALLVGLVFLGLGARRGSMLELLNVMGAMYTAALFMGWNNASSVQPIIGVERVVYYRERAAGLYGAVPYALAQGLIEIPYVVVQTLLYSLVTYSLIQFEWTAGKFWWYTLFMFLTLLYFTFYGMMAISITPNEQLAMVLSSFFFPFWNLLCGFIIPRPDIPVWWRWYYWLSPISWTLYGLTTSQLGDVQTTIQQPGVSEPQTVEQFLYNYFGYEYSWLPYVTLVLIGWTVLFFAVFAYAIKKINFQNR